MWQAQGDGRRENPRRGVLVQRVLQVREAQALRESIRQGLIGAHVDRAEFEWAVAQVYELERAEEARCPLPPEMLVDALQDRVHEDTGPVRAGRSVKALGE
jgi:hypothetical protein